MPIKLDLHVHSESRGKVYINCDQLRDSLRRSGLNGVAITNFFDISHAVLLKEKIKEYMIIVGQEIWTNEGHIIGLGLKKKIDDFLSAEKAINCIHEQGGIAIASHPYLFLGLGKNIESFPIDAVESFNAHIGYAVFPNYLASKSARKRNIPQVASTDTTNAEFIGKSYTEVMVEDKTFVLEAIKAGNVKLFRRSLPIPFYFILKNILEFKNVEPCSTHAVPCLICEKSMIVRIFKKKFKCIDCGKVQLTRIGCCNGHYLCMECVIKRSI